jgi:2-polyprenyl-3-methyl-5-hydroxy-6-metoxy-1,4-benzoquinol methylase
MLAEQGFAMRWYDPLFAPDQGALHERYDFITCSETAEHFAAPAIEFQRLNSLLRPGGWLGVMTRILEDDAAFPQWWYHRDLTHIAFYRRETMNWIATRYGWRLEMPAPNVALFQKAPPRI